MKPIKKGWSWSERGWSYDGEREDNRDPITRTAEEISKSLNGMINFLSFTTESENDFTDGFLPTLDTQTKVMDSGEILYKFYMKPMSNNILIQYGTALPKNTIFASLRQEIVRRMLNTSRTLDWDERLAVVENFIQQLVNSKHTFSFIKALTLQGLTKYKYMVERSLLPKTDPKFMPLYRLRQFREADRKIKKYVDSSTWFRGYELYDIFRSTWK